MTSPFIALLWACWRITRRWYGVILLIAVAISCALGYFILDAIARTVPPGVTAAALNGQAAPRSDGVYIEFFILLFAVAGFAAMSVISIGNKEGFPFRYQFRLPMGTAMLVAVPMLYLCVMCASIYIIPATVLGLLLGVPIPLASPGIILGFITAIFIASSWCTISTLMRGVGLVFSIALIGTLLDQFRAAKFVTGERLSIDSVALTGMEFLMVLAVFVLLLGFTMFCIGRQRCGEGSLRWRGTPMISTAASSAAGVRHISIKAWLEKLTDMFNYPCPSSSAPRAELWLEMKRYGIRIFIIGLGIALAVPLLTLLSVAFNGPTFVQKSITLAPLLLFFGALGISIFNRRMGNGGYMNNFEGTRAMSTVQLAAIQLLALAGTTLAGITLIYISIWISQTLANQPGSPGLQVELLRSLWTDSTLPMRAAALFATFVIFLTAITLFASLHAGSVLWRKKFLTGTLLLVLYAIYFAARVQIASDRLERGPDIRGRMGNIAILEQLDEHMWGFAICVLLLLLVVAGKTVYLKLFTLQSGSIVLLLWLGFLFCSYNILEARAIHFAGMAPELLAFNYALLALPLTLFLFTAWSYDKLRHG